jgi:hypothetical protein
VQEVHAVEERYVGQTVERAPVRRGNEDVVVAGIGQIRPQSAEHSLGDTVGRVADLTDHAGETRLVEQVAGDVPRGDQLDAWRSRRKHGGKRSNQGRGQGRTGPIGHQ